MEGKALIMQQFAGIDAFPICLDEKDSEKIVEIIKAISPGFGAINLEDIETPKVFEIEKRLTDELDIPVFHDDQHGTAIVVLAGLYNALKVTGKNESVKIAIIGAGSAGYGIARLLRSAGFSNLVVFDSKGAIHKNRQDLSAQKKDITDFTNPDGFSGPIDDFRSADVIISAAKPGSLPQKTIRFMKKPSIVFALSNPDSEITLEDAMRLEIDVFGTGRSDYPNQINNSLCFPGFLRALLDLRVGKITDKMKIAAALAIAKTVENPTKGNIVPDTFDVNLCQNIRTGVERATS
jgi:malate dehydrogenase (oxaloacetate-decarboxylating)